MDAIDPDHMMIIPAIKDVGGAADTQVVPFDVIRFPEAPGERPSTAPVPLPINAALEVSVAAPVPPLATGRVPVTLVVRLQNVVRVVPVPPLAIGRVPDTLVARLQY
jgi:hypothetical protein